MLIRRMRPVVLAAASALLVTAFTAGIANAEVPAATHRTTMLSPHVLSTLGGAVSSVNGLNDRDQAVGESNVAGKGHLYHAVLWDSDGTLHDLGSLAGPTGYSAASAINSSGQIVGHTDTPGGGSVAFLYSHGRMRALQPPNPVPSTAVDINDQGQVVGYTTVPAHYTPMMWWHGRATVLPAVRGVTDTYVLANNNRGEILGRYYGDDGAHAVLWQPGPHGRFTVRDLGTSIRAEDINDRGWLVGQDLTTEHAMLWRPVGHRWSATDLGTLPDLGAVSSASSVNDRGQVAGTSGSDSQVFSWQHGTMIGFPTPSGLFYAIAGVINNRGHIGGSALLPSRRHRIPVLWS